MGKDGQPFDANGNGAKGSKIDVCSELFQIFWRVVYCIPTPDSRLEERECVLSTKTSKLQVLGSWVPVPEMGYRYCFAHPRRVLSCLSSARQGTGTASPEYRYCIARVPIRSVFSRLTEARVWRARMWGTGCIRSILASIWSLEGFYTTQDVLYVVSIWRVWTRSGQASAGPRGVTAATFLNLLALRRDVKVLFRSGDVAGCRAKDSG
uniref:Uncharacterized protein n=1 Tax=Ananas comosus var. bracteatus TaxID=296719 RepID=A0A6V7PLT1_ANACO|nr:unnamed protein product [Ananas comosus var. bracteatus]